jgi:hypothetical protein
VDVTDPVDGRLTPASSSEPPDTTGIRSGCRCSWSAEIRHDRGSRSRFAAERFAECYTRLLHALQLAFDGSPPGLEPALGSMFELRLLAQDVLATPDAAGRPAGAAMA